MASVFEHAVLRRLRWVVLAAICVVCAWSLPGLWQLQHDDDVLAFLPPDHPDVLAFRAVAEQYGMLDVALVGLRKGGADLLTAQEVEAIRQLGRTLERVPGVHMTLSFPDFPDPRVEGDTLVVEALVPEGKTDRDDIARRVMTNANAVGTLVSADGTAAAILVYLLDGGPNQQHETLVAIENAVAEAWSGEAYFTGSPFIEAHAAKASRADIERLSPVVIAVLGLTSAVLLGSFTGAALNLALTGLGIGIVLGVLGRLGIPLTIVSGTLPVMLVAFGGAFGMHLIAGYQRHTGASLERAVAALRELWVPVTLSGLTTATAFFALVVMPQAPMREFGIVAGVAVLVLLVLALTVLPSLLGVLPTRWLRPRTPRVSAGRWLPPLWLLAVLAAAGVVSSLGMQADPDTGSVFDEDSAPSRATSFFDTHFGGALFVQIAIDVDLKEPAALRMIRTLANELRAQPGVSDVRTLVEPVALLSEGFGGRRGIPATPEQARRVVTSLADQSAMAQLMTPTSDSALVHVKLAPQGADALQDTLDAVIRVTETSVPRTLLVASTSHPEVARAQRRDIVEQLVATLERPIEPAELETWLRTSTGSAVHPDAEALRARILGTDEVVDPVPKEAYERLPVDALARAEDASAIEALIREHVPELAAQDEEGVPYAAQQLALALDEARRRHMILGICDRLGLASAAAEPSGGAAEHGTPDAAAADDAVLSNDADLAAEDPAIPPQCKAVAAALAELEDATWRAPSPDVPVLRELPVTTRITGQPIVGRAFARSVTQSLWQSTAVSWLVLAFLLAIGRHLRALVPATWTLAVTLGALAWLGHPVSVGTSMVTCIALGAGVDFGIHLSVAARRVGGPAAGRVAANELGAVSLMAGVQLSLAFLVLVVSEMPPLREFGVGLAIALTLAALGAVWWAPRLFREPPRSSPGDPMAAD